MPRIVRHRGDADDNEVPLPSHPLEWPGPRAPHREGWRGRGAAGTLPCCWQEHEAGRRLWKTVWGFLTKRGAPLPRGPAVALLGVYPEELETSAHTRTCTRIYEFSL